MSVELRGLMTYETVVRRPDPRLADSWCGEGIAHDHRACGSLWDSTDRRDKEEAERWAANLPNTSLDLDAIRARVAAATGAPWQLSTDTCDCNDGRCSHGAFPFAIVLPIHTVSNRDRPCEPHDSRDGLRHKASDISDLTMDDAEFIVHARHDIPALLAEVDRLRAALAATTRVDTPHNRPT